MMGVLPLQYLDGQSAESFGLNGEETIEILLGEDIKPGDKAEVVATSKNGRSHTV